MPCVDTNGTSYCRGWKDWEMPDCFGRASWQRWCLSWEGNGEIGECRCVGAELDSTGVGRDPSSLSYFSRCGIDAHKGARPFAGCLTK